MPALAHFDHIQPSGGQIQSAGTLRNNQAALFEGDSYPLRVVAQDTPNNTVKVMTSKVGGYYQQVWLTATQPLDFTEGNSPAISSPESNNRISLLTIDSAGTLAWTYGTQAASPSAPDCPTGKLPLAYIYQRTAKTTIYDNADDNAVDCYIYKDIRPQIRFSSGGDVFGAASSTTDHIVLFADASGKVLKDSEKTLDEFVQLSVDVQLALMGLTGGILATGTYGSGWTEPNLGAGTRLLWYPRKGALRIGRVTGTQWDNASIGDYSYAEGYNNKASGNKSHAEGGTVEASGESSHAEGERNVASGDYAHAEGYYSIASALASHAMGYRSRAYMLGQFAQAYSYFATQGDAQRSTIVLRGTTTDATPSPMLVGASYFTLPASTTWVFHVFVGARSSAGNSAGYEFRGVIKRDGSNNTTLVGSVTKTVLGENDSTWDCNVTANDTQESLDITVTGKAATTIRWVANITLTEIGY